MRVRYVVDGSVYYVSHPINVGMDMTIGEYIESIQR